MAVVPYAIPSNTLIHYDCSLTKKELGRKWAALLSRGCRSSAKPCDSTIYFRRERGNAEALDGLFQRVDVHRLGQMRVHAGLLALFHILKEGVCGQRLRPVRTGSCVDSPIKVATLYSSILLKPFQAYFEFLAIICIKNREEI